MYTDQTPTFKSILSSLPHAPAKQSRKGKAKADEFLLEAYRIHAHLISLDDLLRSVRKAYLSDPTTRRDNGEKYLSDREREEIDARGKMILRQCKERVGMLEDSEKARIAQSTPALSKFLTSLAPTTNPILTAHRSGIIWTLTSLLARLSSTLTSLQEERSKRRQERSNNLGSRAELEASLLPSMPIIPPPPSSSTSASEHDPNPDELTQAQEQQFESENSALLNQMSSTLQSVLHAEKSLLEISKMQTELVSHLVTQTEITDRLYDEAVGSVGDMGMATKQLKKARERGGEARLFLLVFLIGASLALLFLDWYS